jgi:hypothetical protein
VKRAKEVNGQTLSNNYLL